MLEALESPIRQTLPGHADILPQEVVNAPEQRALGHDPESQRIFPTLFCGWAQTAILPEIISSTKLNVQFS
jgi:hypothetical protein